MLCIKNIFADFFTLKCKNLKTEFDIFQYVFNEILCVFVSK